MSSKILVTGATGKVGSEIVRQLVAKGVPVRAGVHHPEKVNQRGWEGAEVVAFDYSDPAKITAALEGIDKVFLMSPPSGDVYVLEKAFIDQAKEAGVNHIVKLSASLAGLDENSSLRKAEKLVEDSGVAYTHLRPSWFAQNFITGLVQDIRAGELAIPTGDGKVGYIDTRDIAAVAVAAFTEEGHTGKAYILTGPEAIDHAQAVEFISKATEKTVKYNPISEEQFRAKCAAQQWPEPVTDFMITLYGLIRNGYAAGVTNTVAEVLGRPPVSFGQFAKDYAAVWQ
jgi:uncharacterized protein YbjT (DUF2867 family)